MLTHDHIKLGNNFAQDRKLEVDLQVSRHYKALNNLHTPSKEEMNYLEVFSISPKRIYVESYPYDHKTMSSATTSHNYQYYLNQCDHHY